MQRARRSARRRHAWWSRALAWLGVDYRWAEARASRLSVRTWPAQVWLAFGILAVSVSGLVALTALYPGVQDPMAGSRVPATPTDGNPQDTVVAAPADTSGPETAAATSQALRGESTTGDGAGASAGAAGTSVEGTGESRLTFPPASPLPSFPDQTEAGPVVGSSDVPGGGPDTEGDPHDVAVMAGPADSSAYGHGADASGGPPARESEHAGHGSADGSDDDEAGPEDDEGADPGEPSGERPGESAWRRVVATTLTIELQPAAPAAEPATPEEPAEPTEPTEQPRTSPPGDGDGRDEDDDEDDDD